MAIEPLRLRLELDTDQAESELDGLGRDRSGRRRPGSVRRPADRAEPQDVREVFVERARARLAPPRRAAPPRIPAHPPGPAHVFSAAAGARLQQAYAASASPTGFAAERLRGSAPAVFAGLGVGLLAAEVLANQMFRPNAELDSEAVRQGVLNIGSALSKALIVPDALFFLGSAFAYGRHPAELRAMTEEKLARMNRTAREIRSELFEYVDGVRDATDAATERYAEANESILASFDFDAGTERHLRRQIHQRNKFLAWDRRRKWARDGVEKIKREALDGTWWGSVKNFVGAD